MATDNYQKHKSKNPLKKFYINNFFATIFIFLKDLKIESVLDVGCGEGFTLRRLKENGIGEKFTGLDSSIEAIKLGKKENPDLDLGIGDIYDLKLKDKSFDLVVSTEVLEHLKKPELALKELKRVSRKYILLSVPNEPWFYLSNYTQWGKDIGHINSWSAGKFREFVRAQGLKILKTKAPFPWILILAKIS
jgi:2-polyprenyl-3-methyl-5-hydroxy-6-metoxy-1,4-benzoquinol methylase